MFFGGIWNILRLGCKIVIYSDLRRLAMYPADRCFWVNSRVSGAVMRMAISRYRKFWLIPTNETFGFASSR